MTDTKALKQAEARRWAAMHVDPRRKSEFVAIAKRLVTPEAKARYQAVALKSSVPWWVIAVIHEREAGQRWDRSIAQGDPIDRRSTHVPVGRGPFASWEDAAVDALVNCAPHASKWGDWSIEGALVLLEEYNGLGYAAKGVPSPYDWSGTDQYKSGKYIRDHVYDPNAVDQQLGCAALLACIAELDPDAHFDNTAPVPEKPHDLSPPLPRPVEINAAHGLAWVQHVLNVLGADPALDEDGVMGPRTREMLAQFQHENDLEGTGAPDPATVAELETHLARTRQPTPRSAPPLIPAPPAPPAPAHHTLGDMMRAALHSIFG